MRLVGSALQGLAARQDLVIWAFQLERDPSPRNARCFQPRRHLQAQHLKLRLKIGKGAKILVKGGFAGNAFRDSFCCHGAGVDPGGQLLNLLGLLAKNGCELSDVGPDKITAAIDPTCIQPAHRCFAKTEQHGHRLRREPAFGLGLANGKKPVGFVPV